MSPEKTERTEEVRDSNELKESEKNKEIAEIAEIGKKERLVPLIIAGGRGSRFWPLSREARPKQLLRLDHGDTLLYRCFRRAKAVAVNAVPAVVAASFLKDEIDAALATEGEAGFRFIAEPEAKNTAAAILRGCRVIAAEDEEAVVAVLPADHQIGDDEGFVETVKRAAAVCRRERALTVIGIEPRFPAVGYGYAERGRKESLAGFDYYRVRRFVEKPHREKARRYLKKGTYSWNSGIVVAPVSVLLKEIAYWLPRTAAALLSGSEESDDDLAEAYAGLAPLSFDSAVLEKEKRVFLVEAAFDWDDVGSYQRLAALLPADEKGNIRRGETLLKQVRDSVVISDNLLTAVIGVKDLVVIEDRGVLLICPRRRVEEIGAFVGELPPQYEKYR